MSWYQWRNNMVQWFADNKGNTYSANSIEDEDHIILLKYNAGAGQVERAIAVSELITSINTGATPYSTYSNLDPTTIGDPDAGKVFVGFYNGYVWTKQSTSQITIVNAQSKYIEIASQGTPGEPTEVNFAPYYPDANVRVEVNGTWYNPNFYTILGTKITFTHGLNQYDIVGAMGSFSYF